MRGAKGHDFDYDAIARAWLRDYDSRVSRAEAPESTDDQWAAAGVHQIIYWDIARGARIIEAIIHVGPHDAAMGYLIAGPVEDYLTDWGVPAVEHIERLAARWPRFRDALHILRQLGMTDDVYGRALRAADGAPVPERTSLPYPRTEHGTLHDEGRALIIGAARGLVEEVSREKPTLSLDEPWSHLAVILAPGVTAADAARVWCEAVLPAAYGDPRAAVVYTDPTRTRRWPAPSDCANPAGWPSEPVPAVPGWWRDL